MRNSRLFLLACLALFLVGDGAMRRRETTPAPPTMALTQRHLREQPLRFEENRGQAKEDARFIARRGGMTLALGDEGASLAISKNGARTELGLKVAGGRRVLPVGDTKLPTKTNYLRGRDRSQWRTDIPTYGKVTYPSVLDGVDVVYHGEGGQLEYDFVVAPGHDPGQVAMEIDGSDGLSLTDSGALRIAIAGGEIIQQRPRVYQRDANGAEHDVRAAYRLTADKRVAFEIAAYDRTKTLIIDPELGYSTFLGGMGSDRVNGIAVDDAGNAFVTGFAYSDDIPGTRIGPRPRAVPAAVLERPHVFVAKLTTGGQLTYFTYVSGSIQEEGTAIAVSGGVPYVTGYTVSSDFPITQGDLNAGVSGGEDAFVLALNGSGTALTFSAYVDIGGCGGVVGPPVTNAAPETTSTPDGLPGPPPAVSISGPPTTTAGATYTLTLTTSSATVSSWTINWGDGTAPESVPGNPPSVDHIYPSGSYTISATVTDNDGTFAASNTVSVNASEPCFPTQDRATSIAVYQGKVYIGGEVSSLRKGGSEAGACEGNCPIPQPTSGAFVASFAIPTTSAALVMTTKILGGDNGGITTGVAVDDNGIYAVGSGAAMPTVINPSVPGYQAEPRGRDAFIVRLGSDFAPRYGTHLGGDGSDQAAGIALGASGHAYVTGATFSTAGVPFPTVNAFQPAHAGAVRNAFVAHINTMASGPNSLVYSTLLGGSEDDEGSAISVDPLGHAFVVGRTRSNNFPNTPFTPRTDNPLNDDAFLTELAPDGRSLIYSAYLGGTGSDRALAVAVSARGVYVGGETSLASALQGGTPTPVRSFPITPGVAQPTFGGQEDGFVLRIGFEPLTISPGQAVLQAGQTVVFTAAGGVGAGYFFTAGGSAGGSVASQSGVYTAGATAGTDVVTVYDAAGNTASAAVIVTSSAEPPVNELQISPLFSSSPPRGQVAFAASQGKPPYVFDLAANGSGGTIGGSDGRYTAGTRGNAIDTVRVTDALGQFKTAIVQVGPGIRIQPASPQVARGGSLTLSATGGTGGPYTWSASAGTVTSSGEFTAPSSSVVAVVTARDALNNTASTNVSVGGAVAISPADPTSFPNGTLQFTAFGGSGQGYSWTLLTSPSTGGTLDAATGAFMAGSTGDVVETIQVKDSNNNRAATTITIGPGLSISAGALTAPARGQVSLTAAGGSGAGYTFTMQSSASGGSVTSEGVYTAGNAGGPDVIRVTDSAGNIATVTITAAPAPAPPPAPPGGTSGAPGGGTSGTPAPGGSAAPAPIGNGRIDVGSGTGSGDDCHVAVTGAPSRTTSTSLAALVIGLGVLVRRRRQRD